MRQLCKNNKTRFFIIVFVFFNCFCSLFLFSNNEELREAKALFGNSLYSQAKAIYKKLLNDPHITPWQRSVLTYNQGLVYLAQQEWEEALTHFNLVLSGENQSPELLRDTYYNNAVALLGLFSESTNLNVKSLLLDETLDALDQSDQFHCKAMKIEGFEECHPEGKNRALRALVEELVQKDNLLGKEEKKSDETEPSAILLSMIKLQQNAKKEALQLIQLKSDEQTSDKFDEVVSKQKLLQNSWKGFLRSVLQTQTTRYYEDKQCQESPWNRVVPLFEEGNAFQNLAFKSLEKKSLSEAIAFQQEAIHKWRDTLIALEQFSESKLTLETSPLQKERIQALTELYQMDKLPETPKKTQTIRGKKPW